VCAAEHARAGDLNSLHAKILRDPGNTELNLQFARMAESSGTLRWALAAYERVLLNDPKNSEARRGMQRVLRSLQPSFTLATLEVGAAFESNPRYYQGPRTSELLGIGSLSVRDERFLFDTRWRTMILGAGQIRQRNDDLNYGYAGIETGPVIDLWPNWVIVPAFGGGAAYFDNHFYYSEAAASGTLEGSVNGAPQAFRVRAAYRKYNDFFPSSEGPYVELRARLSNLGVLGAGSIAVVSPWLLWSNVKGTISNPLVTELQSGAYTEVGVKLEAFKSVASWLTLGGNISLARRMYRTDVVSGTDNHRTDVIWAPGLTAIFPNLIASQSDLRLDYKFVNSYSNDASKSFTDSVVSATAVTRFNPFAMAPVR
jgi:hypothetical protein